MHLESLPLFPQFMRVLCSYKISSFQVSDILAQVILLGVENNNINYQNIYRLVQRLVKNGYLIIDDLKNPYTTYTETDEMMDLRDQFCIEPNDTIDKLIDEKNQLKLEILNLNNEIEMYEELKKSYPDLQFKIEQLKVIQNRKRDYLRNKINALVSLINYISQ